jgi:hypothetical protein
MEYRLILHNQDKKAWDSEGLPIKMRSCLSNSCLLYSVMTYKVGEGSRFVNLCV